MGQRRRRWPTFHLALLQHLQIPELGRNPRAVHHGASSLQSHQVCRWTLELTGHRVNQSIPDVFPCLLPQTCHFSLSCKSAIVSLGVRSLLSGYLRPHYHAYCFLHEAHVFRTCWVSAGPAAVEIGPALNQHPEFQLSFKVR